VAVSYQLPLGSSKTLYPNNRFHSQQPPTTKAGRFLPRRDRTIFNSGAKAKQVVFPLADQFRSAGLPSICRLITAARESGGGRGAGGP